ncbi:unnamed protein product [Prunus brigantina]
MRQFAAKGLCSLGSTCLGLRPQIVQEPVVVLGLNLDRRWLAPSASIIEPVSAVRVDSVFLMLIVRGGHKQSSGGGRFGCSPFFFPAEIARLRHTFILDNRTVLCSCIFVISCSNASIWASNVCCQTGVFVRSVLGGGAGLTLPAKPRMGLSVVRDVEIRLTYRLYGWLGPEVPSVRGVLPRGMMLDSA